MDIWEFSCHRHRFIDMMQYAKDLYFAISQQTVEGKDGLLFCRNR